MHPILCEFAGLTIYTQTVSMFGAFLVGLSIALREARRFQLSRLDLIDVVLWSFLAAILGARLAFLMLQGAVSELTLREFCMLGASDGGLSLHGGLLAGGLVGAGLATDRRLNLWRVADSLAPGLAAAIFILRLGCLANGCDYGVPTDLPWGVPLHGALRHPIQLYEGVANLLLLPGLRACNARPCSPGATFLIYLGGSSLIRLLVDFWRADSARLWGGCSIPQLIAAGLAVSAVGCLAWRQKHKTHCQSPYED